MKSQTNYYHGSNPSAWRVGVPNFRAVEYRSVYPGIDVIWLDNAGQLQYDFHLAPNADAKRINLSFDGIKDLALTESGDLVLSTKRGDLSVARPIAYQIIDGQRVDVAAAFDLHEDRSVGFSLGHWDQAHALIIDPVIRYASYFGGKDSDQALAIAVDAAGNRYLAGSTDSSDISMTPLPSGTSSRQGVDAFVARFTPGGELSYLTYLSGDGTDVARAIVVDNAGRAYIAGQTTSANFFPLVGTLGLSSASFGGGDSDAFVARLDANGQLAFSSYLGGERADDATALALDTDQNLYVAGSTNSDEFWPVRAITSATPYQSQRKADTGQEALCVSLNRSDCHPADGFLIKLSNQNVPALIYATYLGGTGPDGIFALAVNAEGSAIVGGGTGSADFPIVNRDQTLQPALAVGGASSGTAIDGFVARIAPDGALEYATYIGGTALDRVQGLALDETGNIFLTGITSSRVTPGQQFSQDGFPVTDGSFHGGGQFDAFLTKLSPDGRTRLYSTYLGGKGDDQGTAIALDSQGRPVVVGETSSSDFILFPTVAQAWQWRLLGETDGFVALYAAAANPPNRLMSSYLGGTGVDRLNAVVVDAQGVVHVAGSTGSINPSLVAARQDELQGALDVYYAGIELNVPTTQLPDLTPTISADPMPVPQKGTLEYDVTVDNIGEGDATGVLITLDVSNATLKSAEGCVALPEAVSTLLCAIGDIRAGGSNKLSVSATPRAIGDTVFTARIARADQTDAVSSNNVGSLPRKTVDNSGGRAALSWSMLLLILFSMSIKYLEASRRR
ncbi:MAG: SBBP repeat-containing protein [Chromatiales bacterium]|nr:SBBP repeat-containing protein [Chromatiales bacterium]